MTTDLNFLCIDDDNDDHEIDEDEIYDDYEQYSELILFY